MKRVLFALLVGYAAAGATARVSAATVTVDPGHNWLGFMNVFELPSNGGAFVFPSGWGTADLTATFSGPVLTLGPNSVNDPSTFWYQGGGGPGAPGNKNMFASMYVEQTGPLAGQSVTFTGQVVSNTFISPYTVKAFVKDFAPDYSSNNAATVALNSNGVFSVTLNTAADPSRHVQFGFETVGPNVWITDRDPIGNMQIVGIPEPTTFALASVAVLGLAMMGRRRK